MCAVRANEPFIYRKEIPDLLGHRRGLFGQSSDSMAIGARIYESCRWIAVGLRLRSISDLYAYRSGYGHWCLWRVNIGKAMLLTKYRLGWCTCFEIGGLYCFTFVEFSKATNKYGQGRVLPLPLWPCLPVASAYLEASYSLSRLLKYRMGHKLLLKLLACSSSS